jgi:hydroxymethylpyrimidine pyrophosphatase-like HAD family hydrolase
MPRSAPEVMEVADLVLPTGCEDDGVAEYLEELLGRS